MYSPFRVENSKPALSTSNVPLCIADFMACGLRLMGVNSLHKWPNIRLNTG